MHLDRRELFQNFRRVFQLDPVELDVLARGEMAVAAVMPERDMGEHAQLPRSQQAVGYGNPQHIGMALQIQAVLQTERTEFVFRQFIGKAPPKLIAVLRNPFLHDQMIILVVTIHRSSLCQTLCQAFERASAGRGYSTSLAATPVSVPASSKRSIFSGTAAAASEPSVMPRTKPSSSMPSNSQLMEPSHQCPIAAMADRKTAKAKTKPAISAGDRRGYS